MAPVLNFFGISVPSYSLLIVLGVLTGYMVVARRGPRYGVSFDETAAVYVFAAVGALTGGKAFYIIQGLPEFLSQDKISFADYVAQAGLVFYGGMFGALGFVWIAAKIFRKPAYDCLDTVLPALPLTQSFGRIGCFLAGCCYGVPSDFGFCLAAASGVPEGVPLFPVQLVESACAFLIFLLILRDGRRPRVSGFLLGLYLSLYACVRLTLEFYRADDIRGHVGPLSVSQWISIGVLVWGLVLLRRARSTRSVPAQERFLKY